VLDASLEAVTIPFIDGDAGGSGGRRRSSSPTPAWGWTLHGQTRPVDASYRAERDGDGWRVKGKARFRQSDFGMKPFTGAGGTVGVKDEIEVTFTVTLRPPP
jgi:hypothetical protein